MVPLNAINVMARELMSVTNVMDKATTNVLNVTVRVIIAAQNVMDRVIQRKMSKTSIIYGFSPFPL